MKRGGEGLLNLFEKEVWRKGFGKQGGSCEKRKKNPGCIFNLPPIDSAFLHPVSTLRPKKTLFLPDES